MSVRGFQKSVDRDVSSINFFGIFFNFAKLLRGCQKLSSFSREYTEYTGGRARRESMVTIRFLKMLIMIHCICIQGR